MLETDAMWSRPVWFEWRRCVVWINPPACLKGARQEFLRFLSPGWAPRNQLWMLWMQFGNKIKADVFYYTILPGSLRLTHIYQLFSLLCNLVVSQHREALTVHFFLFVLVFTQGFVKKKKKKIINIYKKLLFAVCKKKNKVWEKFQWIKSLSSSLLGGGGASRSLQ